MGAPTAGCDQVLSKSKVLCVSQTSDNEPQPPCDPDPQQRDREQKTWAGPGKPPQAAQGELQGQGSLPHPSCTQVGSIGSPRAPSYLAATPSRSVPGVWKREKQRLDRRTHLKSHLLKVSGFSFRCQRGRGPNAQPGSLLRKQRTWQPNLGQRMSAGHTHQAPSRPQPSREPEF